MSPENFESAKRFLKELCQNTEGQVSCYQQVVALEDHGMMMGLVGGLSITAVFIIVTLTIMFFQSRNA